MGRATPEAGRSALTSPTPADGTSAGDASGSPADRLVATIREGDLGAVTALLAGEPTLAGARARGGETPVLAAVYHDRTEILEVILARRPTLDLFEAAAVGDAPQIRRLLRSEPAGVRTRSGDGWTALHLAAFFGHGDAVDALLAGGADVRAHSTNAHANTPLHAALAGRGGLRIVATLLARGADVGSVAAGGYTPLHLAAGRGDSALVEALLARGADAMARTEDGRSGLDIAEDRGHARVARRLRGEMP